jgi:hypothetical protein
MIRPIKEDWKECLYIRENEYKLSIDPKSIVTARGSVEDWSGENEEERLKEKKKYAKKMIEQHRLGSPNFKEMYGNILSRATSTNTNSSQDENLKHGRREREKRK